MDNIVNIKGKILYKYSTPKNNNVLLRVGCGFNAVSCFIADERLKEQIKEFEAGDYINLAGNIQSSKRNNKYSQTVFVDEVVPPEYTDKSGWCNQFWLDGTVAAVQEFRKCTRITVYTEREGRSSYVPVVFYYPDMRLLNYEEGERIRVQGSIQTIKKPDNNGGYMYYQNYVGLQGKIS